MRILHVIRTLNPAWGGPAEAVRNITAIALERGLSPEILACDDPESPWLPAWRPKVHAVGAVSATYGFNRALDRWLVDNLARFDVVVVSGIWMYYSHAVWKATRKTGTPYYIFIHGALDPWFKKHYPLKHLKKTVYWKAVEHKVLRDAESVLFTTNEEMKLADKAFLPYRCRPVVSGYGISRPGLKSTQPKTDAIARVTLLQPELRSRRFLILLARIHVKKGIDLLLHAFSKTKSLLPNTALLIAGPGSPQTIEDLKGLASRLGISDDVVWAGPLYGEAKWDALRAADAYVLPSHQENFGISVVEALAGGVPVLISDKVNIWREVQAAGAGLVAPDDLAGTIQLLQRWAALSPGEKSQMGQQAVRCFNKNFDLGVTSKRLFEILESHNALSRQRGS